MANYTQLIALDAAQDYNILAPDECLRVTVQEDFDSLTPPTVDLRQRIPAQGDLIKVSKGTPAIYTALPGRKFKKNDVVGTLKTASGSITAQLTASSSL